MQEQCHIPIYLAYAMTAYMMASIIYLLSTKFVGTPFMNSLTKEQIEIKKKSSRLRKKIFSIGLLFSLIILYLYKHFLICMNKN